MQARFTGLLQVSLYASCIFNAYRDDTFHCGVSTSHSFSQRIAMIHFIAVFPLLVYFQYAPSLYISSRYAPSLYISLRCIRSSRVCGVSAPHVFVVYPPSRVSDVSTLTCQRCLLSSCLHGMLHRYTLLAVSPLLMSLRYALSLHVSG